MGASSQRWMNLFLESWAPRPEPGPSCLHHTPTGSGDKCLAAVAVRWKRRDGSFLAAAWRSLAKPQWPWPDISPSIFNYLHSVGAQKWLRNVLGSVTAKPGTQDRVEPAVIKRWNEEDWTCVCWCPVLRFIWKITGDSPSWKQSGSSQQDPWSFTAQIFCI